MLLTGRITDAEYFAAAEAEARPLGLRFPRRGCAHRRARIRHAVLYVLALATSIVMLIFVIWACAGASLPGDVR